MDFPIIYFHRQLKEHFLSLEVLIDSGEVFFLYCKAKYEYNIYFVFYIKITFMMNFIHILSQEKLIYAHCTICIAFSSTSENVR